jgi:hypothetical protein
MGKQGPEFRGTMEIEFISHGGLSGLFGQGQGESGSGLKMVQRDIDAANSQCGQNRSDVLSTLAGKGFFEEDVRPDEAENPGERKYRDRNSPEMPQAVVVAGEGPRRKRAGKA